MPVSVWFWPTGQGYTGQESLEIHLPGSPPLIEKVLQVLFSAGRIRSARPGEFTLRAFLNGRLDLTQAEAVLGVIDAESETSLETALSQLSGNLSSPLRKLRLTLIEALAHLEAGFDFAEEDISFISPKDLLDRIKAARSFIEEKLTQISKRTDHRQTSKIILVGPSNSGKSSLFNRLISESQEEKIIETAIVSDIAGTTRDYLETDLFLYRKAVRLIDTAGFGNNNHYISDRTDSDETRKLFEEQINRITHQAVSGADLIFFCLDAALFVQHNYSLPLPQSGVFIVLTKIDLLRTGQKKELPLRSDLIRTSSYTGEGISELRRNAEDFLLNHNAECDIVETTVSRCRETFQRTRESLLRAEMLISQNADEALVAFEMRSALHEIGKILGAVLTDEILDSIFSRFCIGK